MGWQFFYGKNRLNIDINMEKCSDQRRTLVQVRVFAGRFSVIY